MYKITIFKQNHKLVLRKPKAWTLRMIAVGSQHGKSIMVEKDGKLVAVLKKDGTLQFLGNDEINLGSFLDANINI